MTSSLNVVRFKELSQRPGVSDLVHALGLIPVEWGDAYFELKRFKKECLPFEGVSPLTQREAKSIIENYFFVQLDLFSNETY